MVISACDPIDLLSRKQAFFRENQPDFFDNVYFWMTIDQKNDIISCSSVEFLDSILYSIKLDDNFCNFDFSSTELVKINFYSIVIPMDVYGFRVPVNGNEFILKVYIKNISLEINFRFFCMDFFNRMVILPFLTEVISRIRTYAEYAASVCSHSTPYWVVRDYKTIAIRSHSFVIHPVM